MKCPECNGKLTCSKVFKTEKKMHYVCFKCKIVYDSRQTLKDSWERKRLESK